MARDDAPHVGLVVPDDRLDAVERGLEWGTALLKARRLGEHPRQGRGQRCGDVNTGSGAEVAADACGRGLAHGRRELRLAGPAHAPDRPES